MNYRGHIENPYYKKETIMNQKFTSLAKANADHFNAHPITHIAATAVYGVVAVVAIKRVASRLTTDLRTFKDGHFTK